MPFKGIAKGLVKGVVKTTNKLSKSTVGRVVVPMARAGLNAERKRRGEDLRDSQEFCDRALLIAEQEGIEFADEDAVDTFLDMLVEHALNEMAIGMASIGTIGIQKQSPGPDKYPGLSKINPDGQRAGPETDTRSAGKRSPENSKKDSQSKGPDNFPGLSKTAKDGQHIGPKAGTRSAEGTHPVSKNEAKEEKQPSKMDLMTRGHRTWGKLSKKRAVKLGGIGGAALGAVQGAYLNRSARGVAKGAVGGAAGGATGALVNRAIGRYLTKRDKKKGRESNMKHDSLQTQIYNSLAGKRVRDCVNQGKSPPVKEIIKMAEAEDFRFDNPGDVDNFMKIALFEKLYPSTGPTKHANQMTGDQIPGAMSVSKDQRGLKGNPKDGTIGQNSTGARSPKNKGEAPHNNYKNDGPKGKTQQFEQSTKKVCPVCNQKNTGSNAYCGACGAVLPPRPEDKDGGIPASIPRGGSRNTNIATDGGLPKTNSPYGGSKSKHHYLKSAPPAMTESVTRSSRVIIHDMLDMMENVVSYAPTGVHDKRLNSPAIGSVNAKAQSLGVNPIEQSELDRVVGMFQQGETTKKASMYTGVDARLTQNIANMMGIGDSHGTDLGQTRFTTSHDLA